MRVELVRTGGFTGLTRTSSLDTDDLHPEEAERVTEAVTALEAAAKSAPATSQSHVPRYEFSITREGSRSTIVFDESNVPDAARPLIERLIAG